MDGITAGAAHSSGDIDELFTNFGTDVHVRNVGEVNEDITSKTTKVSDVLSAQRGPDTSTLAGNKPRFSRATLQRCSV